MTDYMTGRTLKDAVDVLAPSSCASCTCKSVFTLMLEEALVLAHIACTHTQHVQVALGHLQIFSLPSIDQPKQKPVCDFMSSNRF